MQTHDEYRRRLLMGMMTLPWWFSAAIAADENPDPRRIIALEWRPTELLLALGVTPQAIADAPNYRNWVVEPPLALSVKDVGLRTEPNMEALQRLRPSLLLLTKGYGPAAESLASIAPVMSFPVQETPGLPFTTARQDVLALGEYLGLADRARQHLQVVEEQLTRTRRRLNSVVSRPVLLFTFLDRQHVMVLGKGSMFQEIMDRVGVTNAWHGEVNRWGSATVGFEQLAGLKDIRGLCFRRGDEDPLDDVVLSPLWQVIPFVRERQWQTVPAVWFFGATIAAMRFCRLLEQSLVKTA
ncbi:Fe(3+)-hydroxamate ABC transporter substrate-binding protein FhuD [Sodalis ligni]|uniref:Iron complex transport system substrate-binding protein n=1 Tax=Sodalis ligni TaxID=2697027 RepID=A0A4R1NEA9_9GAMM|nr:Fe(3+)-hydroxamate ABC transporter substrate-binding protein FhuD [Sodalis ligni]TCL05743.1 iron complex transport system substrate-binding protein [Sodalis ligni]